MKALIARSRASGVVRAPGSKSYSIRAAVCAAMADGESVLENVLEADDTTAVLECVAALGAKVARAADGLHVYGGAFRCLVHVDDNVWKVDKVLWLQEEVLIGTLFMIDHTGDQWARDWFSKMYTYVMDKFPLRQYGYPLWILSADRKVTFREKASRVGNFHHPRHLMLNLLALDRIIGRGNRISGLFA